MSQTLHAVTANRLIDGEVVFWSPQGWADQFADAAFFPSADEAALVVEAAKARPIDVVDPYRIDIFEGAGGPAPVSYRERVRALGPTIHPDLGKQAVGGAGVAALKSADGAGRSSGRLSLIRRK